ncbi:hypothetical protein EXIGLDRAFT_842392 [Exidia glandulosa HHB12029]|uniref:Uncharacterized protein n=1 Tax=Exidia glandulosa HHB12029 TaxID=1314781 RepID=A0A165DC47_EXIGL|nr:hypothetical protein EXIGLDRAFT_842392 [Exidia glandulosa HHB12029]
MSAEPRWRAGDRLSVKYSAGAVLVFLAATDLVSGLTDLARAIVACLSVALSIFILLGVQPRLSSVMLMAMLGAYNSVILENLRVVDQRHPWRDLLGYTRNMGALGRYSTGACDRRCASPSERCGRTRVTCSSNGVLLGAGERMVSPPGFFRPRDL